MKIKNSQSKRLIFFADQIASLLVLLFISVSLTAQDYKLDKVHLLYEIPALKEITTADIILEDKFGYLWISSQQGLYKFDGYDITHYAFDPNRSGEIAGNWIQGLTQDDLGNIWFGVFGVGLQKLDPSTGKFTLYKPDPTDPNSLPNGRIENVVFSKGNVWISFQGGLFNFSIKQGKFKRYSNYYQPTLLLFKDTLWTYNGEMLGNYDAVSDSIIYRHPLNFGKAYVLLQLLEDNKIYLTVNGKMYSYDLASNNLKMLNRDKDFMISDILPTTKYILTSSTDGVVKSYNRKSGDFQSFNLRNTNNKDISNLGKFFQLKNGDVWITGEKILKIIDDSKGIETFDLFLNKKKVRPTGVVMLSKSENGLLAIGESILLDFENGTAINMARKYPELKNFANSYYSEREYVNTYSDAQGNDWIILFDRLSFKNSYFRYSHKDKKLTFLGNSNYSSGTIFGITKIDDDLWVASWRGLLKWNITTSKETLIVAGNDRSKLSSTGLRYIFKDKDDGLWIGTQNGLNYKKKNDDHFTFFFSKPGDTSAISFNGISTIAQDKSGTIWISTLSGGVNSYDQKTGKFTWYTTRQGLANNNVTNLLIDDEQQIWVGHDVGISRINPATKKIENFTIADGISNNMNEEASVKISDGSLIFQGDVFNRIWPAKINSKELEPVVQITNFKLHNKEVEINAPDSVLHRSINITTSLVLKYDQNVIGLQYAALDMAYAENRNYAYMLAGFDTTWQYVGKKREAAFTNLSPGKYILRIKTANRNAEWQEMKDPLYITILPPWWKTWWAYTAYLISFMSILWAFIKYRSRHLKKENQKLEVKVYERTNDLNRSLKELKETQTQLIQSEKMASLGELTAGIAHEIQNPLNFVNNFSEVNTELIDELKQEADKGNLDEVKAIAKDIKDNEQKINHHGKRADAIVKGMLQHSRKSSGVKEPADINALCDEYLRLAYRGLKTKDKELNVAMHTDLDNSIGSIHIIPQDIGRVLLNLYNNAFYAVNEKQKSPHSLKGSEEYEPLVTVTTRRLGSPLGNGGKISISVKDNGNGIPQKIVDKIFQPFFTTKPTGQGTGLGLSLSYDIIKAHGGELKVETKEGEGSTFIITIPVV